MASPQQQLTQQQQIEQVLRERQNFITAYNEGKISLGDMQTAVAYSDQQLKTLGYQPQNTAATPVSATPPAAPNQWTYTAPNPAVQPQQASIDPVASEMALNEAYKQDLIKEFNKINTIPVASSNEEAVAKGYTSYITPEMRSSAFAEIGKGYEQYKQNEAALKQAQQRQAASEAVALKLGLPVELGRRYDLTNVSVPAGQKVVGYEEAPLMGPVLREEDRYTSLKLKTELDPDNPVNLKIAETPLEGAKLNLQQLELRGQVKAQQGTRLAPMSTAEALGERAKIEAGLSPEDLAAYKQWQAERVNQPVRNLGLGLASVVAAPILGPVGAIKAAGIGVGITQGIKVVSRAAEGKEILSPESIITAQEAYEGATTGIVFGGASKVVTNTITKSGISGLVEGVGQGATKTASGVAGRTGVNAALGGSGGFVLSGGDPRAAVEGAAFGAGFGLAGEGLSAVGTKVRGVKAMEVSVVKEASLTESAGKASTTTRITEIQTKEVRIPLKEAQQYEGVTNRVLDLAGTEKTTTIRTGPDGVPEQVTTQGRVPLKDVLFEGKKEVFTSRPQKNPTSENMYEAVKQTPSVINADSKSLKSRVLGFNEGMQTSSTRTAEPIIEAIQGGEVQAAKVKTGTVSDFTNVPKAVGSTVPAVEKVELATGRGNVRETGGLRERLGLGRGKDNVAILTEKTVVAAKDIFPTETTSSIRTFDKITMRGKVTSTPTDVDVQILNKNLPKDLAQKIYKEQGGGYRGDLPKEYADPIEKQIGNIKLPELQKSSAMPKGTNKYFRENKQPAEASTKKGTGPNAEAATKMRPIVKASTTETTFKRAIIDVDLDSNKYRLSGMPIIPRGTQRGAVEEETTPVSYPPTERSKIILSSTSTLSSRQPTFTGLQPKNVFETPTQKQTTTTKPVTDLKTPDINKPFRPFPVFPTDTTTGTIQDITQQDDTTIGTKPDVTPIQTTPPIQDVSPITTPKLDIPDIAKTPTPKIQNIFRTPNLLRYPGGQTTGGGAAGSSRGKRKGFYGRAITEYPVMTAEEILGGKKKRKH